MLRLEGYIFFDTINRTWLSKLVVINIAEGALRMVPSGTHVYKKLVRPDVERYVAKPWVLGSTHGRDGTGIGNQPSPRYGVKEATDFNNNVCRICCEDAGVRSLLPLSLFQIFPDIFQTEFFKGLSGRNTMLIPSFKFVVIVKEFLLRLMTSDCPLV